MAQLVHCISIPLPVTIRNAQFIVSKIHIQANYNSTEVKNLLLKVAITRYLFAYHNLLPYLFHFLIFPTCMFLQCFLLLQFLALHCSRVPIEY